MRRHAGCRVFELRDGPGRRGEVLRGVRDAVIDQAAAGATEAAPGAFPGDALQAGRRAPRRHDPVRGPRGLHDRGRGSRRRSRPRVAEPLLRPSPRRSWRATAAPSRSSSAMRSWPYGAHRSPARTTPSERSGPPSTSSTPSASIGPELQARAAVLTGEAAVTLGATNQGMVAGDIVNTASRLQSVAPPGRGPRRRGDDARRGLGDRLRAGRRDPPEGQGRAGAGASGAAGHRRAAAAAVARVDWKRHSSAATTSTACSVN